MGRHFTLAAPRYNTYNPLAYHGAVSRLQQLVFARTKEFAVNMINAPSRTRYRGRRDGVLWQVDDGCADSARAESADDRWNEAGLLNSRSPWTAGLAYLLLALLNSPPRLGQRQLLHREGRRCRLLTSLLSTALCLVVEVRRKSTIEHLKINTPDSEYRA